MSPKKKQAADQIVQRDPIELIPYEFNNKKHDDKQVDMICNSILSFGFQNPILIDEKNVVIAWHGRLQAAKKLNLETVPCIIVMWLTEAEIKKLRILDNRIWDFAEYDKENLHLELQAIGDPAIMDMFVDFDLWNFEEQNKEVKTDDIMGNSKTCTCPKCWFEFDPKAKDDDAV